MVNNEKQKMRLPQSLRSLAMTVTFIIVNCKFSIVHCILLCGNSISLRLPRSNNCVSGRILGTHDASNECPAFYL